MAKKIKKDLKIIEIGDEVIYKKEEREVLAILNNNNGHHFLFESSPKEAESWPYSGESLNRWRNTNGSQVEFSDKFVEGSYFVWVKSKDCDVSLLRKVLNDINKEIWK